MTSKARQLADLGGDTANLEDVSSAYGSGALSNRNLIINGAMQVAQRGTSFSGLTNGGNGFTLDRWEWKESGSPTAVMTVTQASDAPNEMGNGNSLKIEVTTAQASIASGERVRFEQNIEAQNLQSVAKGTSAAKPVTASFWVKSNKTGTYILEIVEDDNARIISKAYTVDAANTWEYKTITFPADTTGVINNDNGKGFTFRYYLTAGSQWAGGSLNTDWVNYTGNENGSAVGQVNFTETIGNTWQITGVQLEVGDTATPFEHRSYGQELALCQRYFIRWDYDNARTVGNGRWENVDIPAVVIHYPTAMRTHPTWSVVSTGLQAVQPRVAWNNITSLREVHKNGITCAELMFNTGASVPNDTPTIVAFQSSGGNISADAEL